MPLERMAVFRPLALLRVKGRYTVDSGITKFPTKSPLEIGEGRAQQVKAAFK